jgi:hypothetical protein
MAPFAQRVHRHEIHYFQKSISNSLTIQYDVLNIASDTLDIIYDVRELSVSNSLEIRYNILKGGVQIKNAHATVALPHSARLEDVEFTLWVKSPIIVPVICKVKLKSNLLLNMIRKVNVKSALITLGRGATKFKSAIITPIESTYKIKSPLLIHANGYRTNIEGTTIPHPDIDKFKNKEKIKKVLFKHLLSSIDDE